MNINPIKNGFKILFYHLAKRLGLFQLALKYTSKDNRILCYHGGSIQDEHLFWPGVFITASVLKQHLNLIKKYKFNVINLDELVKNMSSREPQKKTLVLTFDDGFYSTQQIIEPLLENENLNATLYVTTHYVMHQSPVFPVTLAYLFFKTQKKQLQLNLSNQMYIMPTKGFEAQQFINQIYNFSQTLNEQEQNQLLLTIAAQLEVNAKSLIKNRLFHILNPIELKQMHDRGTMDIQLHTHRHNFPIDNKSEIEKNRAVISSVTGKDESSLVHFCYPSGKWQPEHYKLLSDMNIQSATTLDYGVNNASTHILSLKRILCTNDKPLIIFEAELCGFDFLLKNTIKKFLYKMKRMINANQSTQDPLPP